ncbi:AAA family ATPase [Streptococcus oralis]|uniref:AAA family ATPase n=1 Tax=Streptococcus oralis TaxID=1303 RepID=UPI00300F15E4
MYFLFSAYNAPSNLARPNPIDLEEHPEEYFKFERTSWNDKFRYKTLYEAYFCRGEEVTYLGQVKFGYSGIGSVDEGDFRTIVNNGWYRELGQKIFSLGQSPEYYQNIFSLGETIANEYFSKVRDIAFDLDLLSEHRNENIMIHSLLREVSASTVKNQFNRISRGGVEITPYNFYFTYKKSKQEGLDEIGKIAFEVKPYEKPQTNSHVLIGRNGVGKSYILDRMIRSVILDDDKEDYKFYQFQNESGENNIPFSGVTLVSFSVFDDFINYKQLNKNDDILFNYVGVKSYDEEAGIITKTLDDLSSDFYVSLCTIKAKNIIERWEKVISYPIFKKEVRIVSRMQENWKRIDGGNNPEAKEIIEKFYKQGLSSGNKIVLLTLTKLVEVVEEKTLVILDEPELHLHPPLMAAFNKALGYLMQNRNGVSIISTHSPVFVQESPKSAVHLMFRAGKSIKIENPIIETYGENIGKLTHEIFRLEYEKSSFVHDIEEQVQANENIADVFSYFRGQLGYEARALARQMMYDKQRNNDE